MKSAMILCAGIGATMLCASASPAAADSFYTVDNQVIGINVGLLAHDTAVDRSSVISGSVGGSTFFALSGVYGTLPMPNNLPVSVQGTNQNAFTLATASEVLGGGGRGVAVASMSYDFTLTTPDGRLPYDDFGNLVGARRVNIDYIIGLQAAYADSVFGGFFISGLGAAAGSGNILNSQATICSEIGACAPGTLSLTYGHVSIDVFPNISYNIALISSVVFDCPNFCGRPSGLGISTAYASSFVDPYLYLDPNTPDFGDYTLTFSQGVGNNPLAGPSAAPEPSSWALLIAGFGLTGGALRRRPRLVAGWVCG